MSDFSPGLEMAARILEERLAYARKNTKASTRDRLVACLELEASIEHIRNHITNLDLQNRSAMVMTVDAIMK